ncbi:discoidin domain-containing protein [Paenibacillus tianjinensis]|uniref:Discoidin domain-containing protein n=1 Tax=Paenibacillus tianjinensis TaxID=2810347 RepID=A0ABX7L609_9BACL|nr:discoidin domain-containing protein [Paenibacillus tianjinensis]QSF43565.1 discoidin domain-containing protein [Paenibacillus tianjinensis]
MATTSNLNAIPVMTSNTSPNGIANASSADASFPAYLAFNGVLSSTGWRGLGNINQWLSYEFTTTKAIAKYSLATTVVSRAVKNFTFEGSNNGTAWDVLDTRTNITNWVANVKQEFVIDSTKVKRYKMYRINSSSNNGDTSYTDISELEMFEIIYSNKILLSSGSEQFASSFVNEDSTSDYVPTLSSATDVSLGITTSASTNSTSSFNAFNDATWQVSSGISTGWLRIQFPNPVLIGAFSSVGWNNAAQSPTKIVFKGSNDGVNWAIIDTFSSLTWTSAVEKNFTTSNNTPYSYYEFSDMTCTTAPLTLDKVKMYVRKVKNKTTKINSLNITEDILIKYGGLSTGLDLTSAMNIIEDICIDTNVLGSGKTFEHSINMSKSQINKITLG